MQESSPALGQASESKVSKLPHLILVIGHREQTHLVCDRLGRDLHRGVSVNMDSERRRSPSRELTEEQATSVVKAKLLEFGTEGFEAVVIDSFTPSLQAFKELAAYTNGRFSLFFLDCDPRTFARQHHLGAKIADEIRELRAVVSDLLDYAGREYGSKGVDFGRYAVVHGERRAPSQVEFMVYRANADMNKKVTPAS